LAQAFLFGLCLLGWVGWTAMMVWLLGAYSICISLIWAAKGLDKTAGVEAKGNDKWLHLGIGQIEERTDADIPTLLSRLLWTPVAWQ
jgi:hypothetical protein